MAKGRDKHQAYLDALNLLGKTLRGAQSKCELLGENDDLRTYDLSGGEKDNEPCCPDFATARAAMMVRFETRMT